MGFDSVIRAAIMFLRKKRLDDEIFSTHVTLKEFIILLKRSIRRADNRSCYWLRSTKNDRGKG